MVCHSERSEAAVLTDKDKMRVGEQPIEHVEHLAHDGDEGDELGFAGGNQAGVEGPQDGIVLRGGDGRHVEHVADDPAAAAHVPLALAAPAVARKRRDPDERRELRPLDRPEFGHVGEERGGQHGAGPRQLAQARGFAPQGVVAGDVFRDEPVRLGQLFFQEGDLAVEAGAQGRAGQLAAARGRI